MQGKILTLQSVMYFFFSFLLAKDNQNTYKLTAKGSACSQEMGAPHDAGLIFSGNDSGTATRIKQISSKAIAVARTTTKLSPYTRPR